jgi:hypothetical protein
MGRIVTHVSKSAGTEQGNETMASKALTITATTDLSTLAPAARKAVHGAHDALANLSPTPARILAAARKVGALRNAGVSVRGVVALMSVAGSGTLPVGKGTIERIGYVADALSGEYAEAVTGPDAYVAVPTRKVGQDGKPLVITTPAPEALAAVFYRVAQNGKASDVARAAELARKSADAQGAWDAVAGVRDELNAAEYRSLTTAPVRPVAGEAGDGGKSPATEPTEPQVTEPADDGDVTTGQAQARLSDVGTGALIAELTRRYSGKRASVLSADADALAALAARVEELVTSGRVAASK